MPPTIGFDPQGKPLHDYSQLPKSLNLSTIIVGKSGVSLDGWVLPYGHLSKGSLLWLRRHLMDRIEAQPEDKPWAQEIVDTILERYERKF